MRPLKEKLNIDWISINIDNGLSLCLAPPPIVHAGHFVSEPYDTDSFITGYYEFWQVGLVRWLMIELRLGDENNKIERRNKRSPIPWSLSARVRGTCQNLDIPRKPTRGIRSTFIRTNVSSDSCSCLLFSFTFISTYVSSNDSIERRVCFILLCSIVYRSFDRSACEVVRNHQLERFAFWPETTPHWYVGKSTESPLTTSDAARNSSLRGEALFHKNVN